MTQRQKGERLSVAPKAGTRVECKCAPGCEACWHPGHGPCIRGVVVETHEVAPEPGLVLVKQDHGGFDYWVDIGYGQKARRSYAAEVWAGPNLRILR